MKQLAQVAPMLADEGAAVLITVVVLVILAAVLVAGWIWAKRRGWIG